jgi:hypothetical protein
MPAQHIQSLRETAQAVYRRDRTQGRVPPPRALFRNAVAEENENHAFRFPRDPRGMDARWIASNQDPRTGPAASVVLQRRGGEKQKSHFLLFSRSSWQGRPIDRINKAAPPACAVMAIALDTEQ